MASNALKGMYAALSPLGFYRLDGESLVGKELAAYDTGFSLVENLLGLVENQAFVQTAGEEHLPVYEKLVGLPQRKGVSLADRRALVLYRMAVAPFDFTLEGMTRSAGAAGLEAELVEHPADERLTVVNRRIIDEFEGLDSLKARLETMLPAHLEWELDAGDFTWDMFDETDVLWDRWDELDFSWDLFELDGYNLLTKGGA